MKIKTSAVILVFNEIGDLALQLRSATDNSYPLHWDFSAAGGLEKEEDFHNAAKRELFEEIGINAELEYIGEFLYIDHKAQDTLYIFKTIHNGPFKVDPIEVEKVQFFSLIKIEEMLQADEKFHPEFPFLWEKLNGFSDLILR